MKKLTKDFFEGGVLLWGYTEKDKSFCRMLHESFTAHQVPVYALSSQPGTDLGFQTFETLEALPKLPGCAYLMCPKEELAGYTQKVKEAGIGRILLYSKKKADEAYIAACEKDGIEVRVGCPLILYGSGPCSLHAAIGGYREERHQ